MKNQSDQAKPVENTQHKHNNVIYKLIPISYGRESWKPTLEIICQRKRSSLQ